ncbi:hypothetical protein [Nocardia sp. NPDC051832]|uniref:hypothetical protein n=1 Tax=Nocardia sp. NPDC051832 TaxID=3155673 RepID=UPI00342BF70E
MNTSTMATKLVILLSVILLGLAGAAIGTAIARHEGASWPKSLQHAFVAFGATCSLCAAMYTAFILLP